MASSHGNPEHLLPPTYKSLISAWLAEDCPGYDYGGFVVGESPSEAKLLGKSEVGSVCFPSLLLPTVSSNLTTYRACWPESPSSTRCSISWVVSTFFPPFPHHPSRPNPRMIQPAANTQEKSNLAYHRRHLHPGRGPKNALRNSDRTDPEDPPRRARRT